MTFDTIQDRSLLPDYNFCGISRRTKSGHMVKNYTFYRSINRDNLWNDPYHASTRTWKAFHEITESDRLRRSRSTDAADCYAYQESLKREFVNHVRSLTRERLDKRKVYNRLVATAPRVDPFTKIPHVRQDVCSGMTRPIGGNVDDLPVKSLRNIMTPSIARMDDEACARLTDRLNRENQEKELLAQKIQIRRNEIIEDRNRRHRTLSAIERLSGIRPRSRAVPENQEKDPPSRVNFLAMPRREKLISPSLCLDALELVHISHPTALEHLH